MARSWDVRGAPGARPPLALVTLQLVLACLLPRPAVAADDPNAPAQIAIVIDSAGQPRWRASALAHSIRVDISAYSRLDAAADPSVKLAGCAPGDRRCQLAAYRDAGFDIVMLGRLTPDQIRYELHQTWSPATSRFAIGWLVIADTDEHELRQQIRGMLDPVLRSGGALDQKRDARTVEAAAHNAEVHRELVGPLLGGIALLLAIPFLLGALRGRGLKGLFAMRSFRWTIVLWLGLIGLSFGATAWGERVAAHSWGVSIAGGILWGLFAIVVARAAFPPFGGLDRIEHRDVFRLIRAWSLMTAQRTVRVCVYYAPFFIAFWFAYRAVGVSESLALQVLAPLWGLLAHFWLLSLVENLARGLDARLVKGDADADNPWHVAAHNYVMGYINRAGWDADERLLADVLFLPGDGDAIELYGGGLTHSRVVIGQQLLEFALAPYDRPHDYAAKREHKLLWSEWNAGLVVPVEIEGTIPTTDDRRPRAAPIPGETEHLPLGQPPTLAGFVEPAALDHRLAFRPAEDPLWLDWDPTEEWDGTDPNDKDFLFGALVYELGAIGRGENLSRTVGLSARRWLSRRPKLLGRIAGAATAPFRAIFSRYPAIVADAFAALNHARHHLMQYLAWREWKREDLLTARAYAPELEAESSAILAELEQRDSKGSSKSGWGATPRKRLIWMSSFFHEPVSSRGAVWAQRALLAAVALAALTAAGFGIKQAIDYHPTYEKRIDEQRKAIEQPANAAGGDPKPPAPASPTPTPTPTPTNE